MGRAAVGLPGPDPNGHHRHRIGRRGSRWEARYQRFGRIRWSGQVAFLDPMTLRRSAAYALALFLAGLAVITSVKPGDPPTYAVVGVVLCVAAGCVLVLGVTIDRRRS